MNERDRIEGGIKSSLEYPASKAGGYFFAPFETFPYRPLGVVLGQCLAESCVPACCRMLLSDQGTEIAEAFIRHALELKEGAFVSQIPATLQSLGFSGIRIKLC